MQYTVKNISNEALFIPGPNVNVEPGESVTVKGISLPDVEGNEALWALGQAGKIELHVALEAPGLITSGAAMHWILPTYTVATLPSVAVEGQTAFATDGLKSGETTGNGTGVPVYWSNGQWRVMGTDAQVQS